MGTNSISFSCEDFSLIFTVAAPVLSENVAVMNGALRKRQEGQYPCGDNLNDVVITEAAARVSRQRIHFRVASGSP